MLNEDKYTKEYSDMLNEFETMADKSKELKKVLKKKFPKTKFSVSKRSSALMINYTDGPTKTSVEEFANKYEDFDRDSATGEILSGGNIFVFVRRTISSSATDKMKKLLDNEYVPFSNSTDKENEKFKEVMLGHLISTTDFTKKLTIKRNKSGNVSEAYVGNSEK